MDPISGAVYLAVSRYIFPTLGFWILLRCGSDLLKGRRHSGRDVVTLLLVTVFQGLNGFGFWLAGRRLAVMGYWGIAMIQWLMLLAYVLADKRGFALEALLFFLCSIGIGVVVSVKPEETAKQVMALAVGVTVYLSVLRLISNARRSRRSGWAAALFSLTLLAVTTIFGKEYYGAKSWLVIGPLSVQPSEFCKVCFVYAGAMFLNRGKRGLVAVTVYAALVCFCLIWMNDFGTAAVFFAAFLVMVLLRYGAVVALGLAAAGTGLAVWRLPAHALRRIAIWRHIWEQPLAGGYQQTRGLQCIAAGGLFGLGIGAGKMGRIFASDSDFVFAAVCETWGMLVAVLPVIGLALLLVYSVKKAQTGDAVPVIAGCGAAAILGVQGALNVLGTVDLLPMTGVTLPFVSNGGSAMVASWGLAAFIKAMGEEL